jgi:hypothetical protein
MEQKRAKSKGKNNVEWGKGITINSISQKTQVYRIIKDCVEKYNVELYERMVSNPSDYFMTRDDLVGVKPKTLNLFSPESSSLKFWYGTTKEGAGLYGMSIKRNLDSKEVIPGGGNDQVMSFLFDPESGEWLRATNMMASFQDDNGRDFRIKDQESKSIIKVFCDSCQPVSHDALKKVFSKHL